MTMLPLLLFAPQYDISKSETDGIEESLMKIDQDHLGRASNNIIYCIASSKEDRYTSGLDDCIFDAANRPSHSLMSTEDDYYLGSWTFIHAERY